MQGAGGVGGLLATTCRGAQTTNCFAAYDGNGNVVALVNGADASIAAQYEYAPFGELLRATGPMAKSNPFRFSTKYRDDETDLVYYGFRYLKMSAGRWTSREPEQGEESGLNLYGCAANDPENETDVNGLQLMDPTGPYDGPGTIIPPSPPTFPPEIPAGGTCPFEEYGEPIEFHYKNLKGVWIDSSTLQPVKGDPLEKCRATPCSKGNRFCEAYYIAAFPSTGGKPINPGGSIPRPLPTPSQQLPFPVYFADVSGKCKQCDKSCTCATPFFCGKVVHAAGTTTSRIVTEDCECRSEYD